MKQLYIFTAILFLTFLVWAPTLSTYFSQDDWVFLSHVYKQPFSYVFKHYQESFYRPVGQQLFFFLGSRIFGLEAQGFHLFGLLIHLFNVFLLNKLLNIWGYDRRVKYFLLAFYAVNPVHFVALNWLTQVDIEIAVSFGLLTILFWKKTLLPLGFFAAALLSHETAAMLPVAMAFWIFKGQSLRPQGLSLMKPMVFFGLGVLVLVVKFLVNPFSLQSDYSLNFNLWQLLSTLKWYGLRALVIPEGIRNLPIGLMILSLIPGLILILMFKQKLLRGLGVYLLGVLPVLGFGGHLLAAYAVFGIALMAVELSRWQDLFAGRLLSAARISSTAAEPESTAVRSDASRPARRLVHNLYHAVLLLAIGLPSVIFIFNVSEHWSTTRGLISWGMTQKYVEADSSGKKEILQTSADFVSNPEIYFSTMMGRQFEVLDRGIDRGIFGWLFYRGNDLTTQFLPDAEFFKNSILAGRFPVWNPWIFAGMPYFLDPQNFLWYPPNYIFLSVPVETGFLILLIGHLVLAGWGVKRVLGEFGVFGKLALLGVGMFVLSPKLVGHIEEGNWTLVIAACWLPVLYFGLKKNKFWLTVLSLSAIIINNLNIGYYSVLFVILFSLFQIRPGPAAARLPAGQARPGLKMLKILVATVILTIPRWLPLLIFGGQTVRADLLEAPLPVWSWTKVAKSLVFPLGVGHPALQNEEILYLGIVPIGLVLLGVLGKLVKLGFKNELKFWIIWLAFVFLVALNNKTPLFYLIKWLPGFSLLRITTRPWIFAALGVALGAPMILDKFWRKSRVLGLLGILGILGEFSLFGYGIFSRRETVLDPVPARFYRQMTAEEIPVRVYCTTGCLDRLTAQRMGIALLGGNNPIQLKSSVEYLQQAGGYKESAYHPIQPPYTVFNQKPQPDADLLAKTATEFVVSPYELKDNRLELIDFDGEYRLYKNTVDLKEYKEHYFN